MRVVKSMLVIVLILSIHLPLAGAAQSEIRLNVRRFSLENGMLFLVVERKAVPQVAFRLGVRAGSALENRGKTGIAHLLEHMMFKGTRNFGTLDFKKDETLQKAIETAYQTILREQNAREPNEDLIREKQAEMAILRREVQKIYVPQAFSAQLERNGAVNVNAFTTKDQTQYTVSLPADMIELWFSIVSEQIFEPAWREFYVEKEVVQREYAYRYVNNPVGAVWLDLAATAYSAHPYRNPVIGWAADMETFNTTAAKAFHAQYYTPANTVAVLVGDVDPEQVKELAQIYFSRYPAGTRAPERVTAEPPQEGPRQSIRYLKGARTPLLRIGFHGPAMGTRDFYALDAMIMILSYGMSSRLNQEIVNKGLAVEAWAANPDNRYGGMIVLGGSPLEPQGFDSAGGDDTQRRAAYLAACQDLEGLLLKQVARMQTDPVTERELARVKKMNRRDFIERLKDNESLAGTLASLEIQVGASYLDTYLAELAKVTPAEIQAAAQKYLVEENRTTAVVIPGGPPEKAPQPYNEVRTAGGASIRRAETPADLVNHSIYPTPKGWKHPLSFSRTPQKITYPEAQTANIRGADLFFLKDEELPLIDVTLLVKAGDVDLPDSRVGLTDLLDLTLVEGGAGDYAPHELTRILDENAIRISIQDGLEDTAIHLSVMKPDWEMGLSLLKEILTRPRFDQEVLNAARQQILIRLSRQADNAQAVSRREGMMQLFAGHVYGRDPLMALNTVPHLTADQMRDYLVTYMVPANMVVAVAGDIGKKEAVAGLDQLLAALPQSTPPPRRLDDPRPGPGGITLIHKPGQVQSQIFLGLLTVKRTNPDFWKLGLLTDILGGSDSLMYRRLRDDLGLVYAAGMYQSYKWQAGYVGGYIGCKGDRTVQALDETVALMRNLTQTGVSAQELEQKRLDVLNGFVFNVDTPDQLATVYARYRLRHEPLDTLSRIQDAYIQATKEQLDALAAKHIDLHQLQIVVVGDKTTIVKSEGDDDISLEADIRKLAERLELPFQEKVLR